MPIYRKDNPYRGVNAHFNSLLQNMEGGWPTFHAPHITHLTEALNETLPDNYYAVSEQSLQIELLGIDSSKVRPDVTVLRRHATPIESQQSTPKLATPLLEIAAADLMLEEDELMAVMVYRRPDEPVTRIELLSPTNKTTHQAHYLTARQKTLHLGLNLVEIDYLHETPPLFGDILAKDNLAAYPYLVMVTDPTPTPDSESGVAQFYGFHVDEPMVGVPIPLAEQTYIALDLSAVYNVTFSKDRRPSFMVDYEQLPLNLEAYSPADQAKILAVMQRAGSE
jgi:hypothetical protein